VGERPDGATRRGAVVYPMNTPIRDPDRVRRHTAANVNARIDNLTRHQLWRHRGATRAELSDRIEELDREWDIERVLELNAASLALAGVVAAASGRRGGLMLSGVVLGFLWMHAVQGWCPPVPILRRLGIRTRREIDREKFALKVLRGDFDEVDLGSQRRDPESAWAAALA